MTGEYVAELIRKYADGTASEEEIKFLMNWYHSHSINEVEWPGTNANEQRDVYNRMLQRLQNDIRPKRKKVLRITWLRAAAVLLLLVGAAFIAILFSRPSPASYITVTNSFGKVRTVTLPDGSSVWLNAASKLRYTEDFRTRRDLLLEGEAFFNVKPDAAHPFSVKAGDVQTTVLGTSFNIKAYKDEMYTSVSVVTGRVRVGKDTDDIAVLTPGLQLLYDKETRIAQTQAADTSALLAWKNGKLHFAGERFEDIIKSLERWYGVTIKLSTPEMKNCRYYMSFENDNSLEKLLATLKELTDIDYAFDKNNPIVTLTGEGCR